MEDFRTQDVTIEDRFKEFIVEYTKNIPLYTIPCVARAESAWEKYMSPYPREVNFVAMIDWLIDAADDADLPEFEQVFDDILAWVRQERLDFLRKFN